MGQRQIVITYSKPGTRPPVFLAGTYSEPAWEPRAMDVLIDDYGEYHFKQVISVQEGTEVQYKFRIGHGNWWVLHDDVETVWNGCHQNSLRRIGTRDFDDGDFEDEVDSHETSCHMFSHGCSGDHDLSSAPSDPSDSDSFASVMDDSSNFVDVDLKDPRTVDFHNDDNQSLMAEIQRIVTSTNEAADGMSPSSRPRAPCGSAHSVRSNSSLSSIEEGSGDGHYQIHSNEQLSAGDRTPRYDWLSQETIPAIVEGRPAETHEASSDAEPASPTSFFWALIARLFTRNQAGVSH